jgi:hypothetical protein
LPIIPINRQFFYQAKLTRSKKSIQENPKDLTVSTMRRRRESAVVAVSEMPTFCHLTTMDRTPLIPFGSEQSKDFD